MNIYNENIDVRLDVNARVRENFDRVWLVNNEDGSGYDFTDHVVVWEWYRVLTSPTPEFVFKINQGLELAEGEIRLTKTAAQMTIQPREYFHFLRITDPDGKTKTWLNGLVLLNIGLFNGNPATLPALTINPNGTVLTIQINSGSASGGITTPDELIDVLGEATEVETNAILDLLKPLRYDDSTIVFYDNGSNVAYDNF